MRVKVLISVLVLFSLLASCNLPIGQIPATQPPAEQPISANVDTVATSVALTVAAHNNPVANPVQPSEATETFTPGPTPTFTLTPTFTFTPTQCGPTITANVVANVRSGPGTVYDIVGSLALGQSASVVGRNDAYTWWYIDYTGASGGHAWIAGSVVTSACIPSVVQVVAAPPLPTAEPTEVTASDSGDSGSSGQADLVPLGMSVHPSPRIQGHVLQVTVGLRNQGDHRAGNFNVQWWSSHALVGCSWPVSSLAAGESINLTCNYTYAGCSNYDNILLLDSGNSVHESNEGNNSMSNKLLVKCGP